ncbi:MAG TPA: tape measure protein [Cellvibrio sp.]|nr:tape measure protein [Cellvibrio sp.]
MAVKDSVLNFVIKAKNLASDVVAKFSKDVESLDSTSADASKSVTSLGDATDNLGKDANGASSGTKTLNAALSDVSDNASDAAEAMSETEKEAAETARKLHETGVAADKAASAVGKMGQRYDAAGKPIETTRQEIKKTNDELKEANGSSAKAGDGIGKLVKRLLGLAAAVVGVRTITSAFRSMFDTGDKFERLSLQMEQTMGSLAAGEQATAWVKDFAKNTPLQLQEVTDTFLRLKNFGLDPLDGSMQAIVDQSAKLGKGYEAVEGISLALGQAWAKQKLQGEEILQLVERGVPVWDLLAKATGKNTAELQKMSEAGLLGRDTIKALLDEMGRQSAGAAAQNMTLLSGYISNLTDEWQLFLNEIAQSGALDYAKEQLRQLIQYVQEMKENGQLQQWAKNISDAFIATVEASKTLVFGIKENIGAVALLAKAYAAVKLVEFATDAKKLASNFLDLANSKKAAATQTGLLANVMRSIPWLLVVDGVSRAVTAYNQLREAKARLAASQSIENEVQEEATRRINEFNQQTGLAVQSLDEIIAMQNAGAVAIDDYSGKWRLATNQITEAERAERANIDAMKQAQQERQNYLAQVDGLLAKFSQVKSTGGDVAEAIAAIGKEALTSGEGGIQALATAIQNIAFEGKTTKDELQNGLAAFLKSLSDEQYKKFGVDIEAALKKIQTGSSGAQASLGALSTLMNGDMRAAAQRLGIDLGEVLNGIDADCAAAISNFTTLAQKLNETSAAGDDTNKILKAGLLATLKSLDTTQEINATRAALQQLAADGVITQESLVSLNTQLNQQAQNILTNASAQKTATDANEQAAASWGMISVASNDAAQKMQLVGGAAKWLQDVYKELRGEIEALGPAALAAFEKLQNVNPNTDFLRDEFGDLKQAISDATNEIDRLQQVSLGADFTGISRYLRDTMINAELVKKEYTEQKLALEQLQQAYANGAISARNFISSARGAASSTSLLNNADLSALKNQIRAAQDQMDSFRKSTLGTLNSLQSELADLQGNAERVAQLAYETRIADLNAKLEEARKTGDKEAITNAQQALRVAQEIYAIKKQQLAEEKKAQERAETEEAARRAEEAVTDQQQNQNQPPQTQQPNIEKAGMVQRLEIALPSGKSASLTGSVDDVNNLLNFLNEAGLRSLQ